MSTLAKAISVAILMGTAGHAAAADTGAVDRALAAIRQNPAATRLSASDTFTAHGVTVDRNGTEHVRMERTYKGLPVIGGDLVVHSRAGAFKSASLTQAKPLSVSTTPTITASQAITEAGVQFGTQFDSTPTARLAVYARKASPRLAYDVLYTGTAKDGTPIRMHYYVDAANGAILDKSNAIETGTLPGTGGATGNTPPPPNVTPQIGTGKSLMAGVVQLNTQWNATRRVYEMNDLTRGNTHIHDIGNGYRGVGTIVSDGDNKWGNGSVQDRASAAVDASYGLAKTWDFYKTTFNRLGIFGDGKGALGIVHFQQNYNNAFWSNDCFCMAFGDGDGVNLKPLVALDVMGHEMSHGVTHATAGLIYSGESGGLNEANSDILGHDGGVLRQQSGAAAELLHRRSDVRQSGHPGRLAAFDVQAEHGQDLGRLLSGRFRSELPGLLQERQGRALHLRRGEPLLLPARRGCGGADGSDGPDEPGRERPGLQRQHRPGWHRPRRRPADLVPRTDGVLHQ